MHFMHDSRQEIIEIYRKQEKNDQIISNLGLNLRCTPMKWMYFMKRQLEIPEIMGNYF